MIVTHSYDEIDRLFYERLRRAVVSAGHLPDKTLYNSAEAYKQARENLIAINNPSFRLIDVIGVGPWDNAGEKTTARIVISRVGEDAGAIGGFPADGFVVVTEGDKTTFDKKFYPDFSVDLLYEVRIISDLTKYDRLLSAIVNNSLHRRRHLPTVTSEGEYSDKYVMVVNSGSVDVSSQNFLERVFRFRVEDVFIEEPELILSGIPLMTTVVIENDYEEIILHNPSQDNGLPLKLPFTLSYAAS